MTALCGTFERVSGETGQRPRLFMSHIAGIYDQYLKEHARRNHIDTSPDILWQAGLAVARKAYRVMKERGYSAVFIGGGARGLQCFTEMVGSDSCIAINWQGTADALLEQNPPVVEPFFNPVRSTSSTSAWRSFPTLGAATSMTDAPSRSSRALGRCSSFAAASSRAGSGCSRGSRTEEPLAAEHQRPGPSSRNSTMRVASSVK
jgi:hypothetical protein